jgi:hypothetical protein
MDTGDEYPFPALRARIAQLHAEGREAEREAACWLLADRIAQLGQGQSFNPYRRRRAKRFRYPVIEAA